MPRKSLKKKYEKLSEEDLIKLAAKYSISLDEIKKEYTYFEELTFFENEKAISSEGFSSLVLYDRQYHGKLKDMNQFIDFLFKALDRDSSGKLSFKEYLQGKKLLESNDLKDHIKFIFYLLDMSNDKKIEKNEIQIFLRVIHKSGAIKDEFLSDEDYAEKMLNDLDLNKDGVMNEEEFIEGILKNETYANFIRSIKPENLSL